MGKAKKEPTLGGLMGHGVLDLGSLEVRWQPEFVVRRGVPYKLDGRGLYWLCSLVECPQDIQKQVREYFKAMEDDSVRPFEQQMLENRQGFRIPKGSGGSMKTKKVKVKDEDYGRFLRLVGKLMGEWIGLGPRWRPK